MSRQSHIFAIAAFGLLSGLLNPIMLALANPLAAMFASSFLITGLAGLSYFFTILFAAAMTIMLGGIPAALYERVTGQPETNGTSWFLWLSGTAVFALPAVINGVGILTR